MAGKENFQAKAERFGNTFIDYFHIIGLFILGLTVIYSAILSYIDIIASGKPTLKDVLLIFIYLEVGAMIGIYFKTHRLPVQFLIYIAITALTRVLTIDIKQMTELHIITITGAILMLVGAIFVINYTFKDDCQTCRYNQLKNHEEKEEDINLIDIATAKPN